MKFYNLGYRFIPLEVRPASKAWPAGDPQGDALLLTGFKAVDGL